MWSAIFHDLIEAMELHEAPTNMGHLMNPYMHPHLILSNFCKFILFRPRAFLNPSFYSSVKFDFLL